MSIKPSTFFGLFVFVLIFPIRIQSLSQYKMAAGTGPTGFANQSDSFPLISLDSDSGTLLTINHQVLRLSGLQNKNNTMCSRIVSDTFFTGSNKSVFTVK